MEEINKEKEKEMLSYMKEYRELENKKSKAKLVIEKFKKQYEEIFDTLELLECEVELIEEDQQKLAINIKDSMNEANVKNKEVGNLKFTYVTETIKRNFNSKKFFNDYSPKTKMYKEYVTESTVSDYVKVKRLENKDKE